MLSAYQDRTNKLLQYPVPSPALYQTSDLTTWINMARGQVAGEGNCIRVQGTISLAVAIRNYNFSAINTGTPTTNGVQGVIHVRDILYAVASGFKRVNPRNWEWFQLYSLNNPVPQNGPPLSWSQYGQGSAGTGAITGIGTGTMSSGSFYLDPPPDLTYNLMLDCVCYPIALAADTDVEALPYLWTDAVPYFAAYLALMSAQTQARIQQAETMLKLYQTFMQRARQFANPDLLRWQYQQSQDVAAMGRFVHQSEQRANGA